MKPSEVTILCVERKQRKAHRDATFVRRFAAEYRGEEYVVWYDMEGWVGAHLPDVLEVQRRRLVEGLYTADLRTRIATGELRPGTSNVYFGQDASAALPGEIMVSDALERVRALPGAK